MASDFGKNDDSIQTFVNAVQSGFVDLRGDLRDIRERLIRVEESSKNYVTMSTLTDKIAPMERKIQTIEEKQPSYIKASTIGEKAIAFIAAIASAILIAYLTMLWVKP